MTKDWSSEKQSRVISVPVNENPRYLPGVSIDITKEKVSPIPKFVDASDRTIACSKIIRTDFYSLPLGNLMWLIMGGVVAVQKIDAATHF